jgi:hypothetical protein
MRMPALKNFFPILSYLTRTIPVQPSRVHNDHMHFDCAGSFTNRFLQLNIQCMNSYQ